MPAVGPITQQQITLLTQIGQALTAGNVNNAVSRVDGFTGVGNNSNAIDTNAEINTLIGVLTAVIPPDAPNRDELVEAQRQVMLNINQLIPNGTQRANFFRALATQMAPNNPLRSDPNIMVQVNWYANNRNTTIGVANRHQLAEQLLETGMAGIPQNRLNGLSGWQLNARQMFHGAWNNDGPGIQFTSTQEFIAMHAESRREAMEEQGEQFNETEFNRQFNQLFMRSVREDTNFSLELIAQQASMALCRSRFTGEGSDEFRTCLLGLNQSLWEEVGRGRPPGTILYADQSGIPGHGHMIVSVGEDGEVRIDYTEPTQGALFDFGADEGTEGGSVLTAGVGSPPIEGSNDGRVLAGTIFLAERIAELTLPTNLGITPTALTGFGTQISHISVGNARHQIPQEGLRIGNFVIFQDGTVRRAFTEPGDPDETAIRVAQNGQTTISLYSNDGSRPVARLNIGSNPGS